MPTREQITLINVISRVKNIADAEYDGKIYDNILAIFNKLHTKEKRVLLKGLINICFVVEDKMLVSTDDLMEVKEVVADTKTSVDNVIAVEQNNKEIIALQIIQLKKMLTLALIIFLAIVLLSLLLVLFSSQPNEISDIVAGFFDLASKLF